MKYAIIESGGKQYKAVEGSQIEVDLLQLQPGESCVLDQVLLVVDDEAVSVGAPTVKGAHVQATVVGHTKGPKIVVFKYRPKKHYRVKTGHRQQYTRLQVESISLEK
ncbi:MAG: 50S ribosomal protein L21 [Chloroflexi bacterium]|nr:50S ribosomal protein L21 [Chloroflexota bacterium]